MTYLREYSVDLREGPKGNWIWRTGGGVFLCLFLFVIVRNWLFFRAGMLDPDFGVIHEAYDFNLGFLPKLVAGVALGFVVAALFAANVRRAALVMAALYLFVAADLAALRFYVTRMEPERLVVRRIELQTPKLTEPLRLVHLSDIQAGAVGPYEEKIFETVKGLQPDLILNTGDYLQVVPPAQFAAEFEKLRTLMRAADPGLGIYGVFGDTDLELYRLDKEALSPLRLLSSRSETMAVPGGSLSIHGLSLYQSRNPEWGERSVSRWLEESDAASFRILLGHAPDYALGLADARIDLCLAGHTHGGQVRIPGFGPLVIDSAVPEEWSRGFRRIGIPYLNVSAGAGSNRYGGLPPLRFNCPTELTVIDLVPLRTIR